MLRSASRYRQSAVGLCAIATILLTRSARADVFSELERGATSFGGGVFVGYQFGPTPGVEWGLEAFATRRFRGTGCTSVERTGLGPLMQIGVMGMHNPRLTLALQGGGELVRALAAISGEIGLTYRFGDKPGFAIHLGLVPESFFITAPIRYEALRNELWVGGGLRVLPTYGQPSFCEADASARQIP